MGAEAGRGASLRGRCGPGAGGASRLPRGPRVLPELPTLSPRSRWGGGQRLRAARPGPCRGLSRRGAASGRREGGEADLKVLTGKRARHRPESRRAVKSEELSWRGGAVRGHLSLARVEARLPHRPRVTMAAISSSARASVHEWIAEDACAPLRSGGSRSAPFPPAAPVPRPPPARERAVRLGVRGSGPAARPLSPRPRPPFPLPPFPGPWHLATECH